MRKQLKAILIIIPVLIALGLTLTFVVPFLKQPEQPPTSKGLVYIYVQSSIYDELTPEIQQYETDVKNQGYDTQTISWISNNVLLLKQNLSNAYSLGLKGAVLIGDLPYAMARHWDFAWSRYWNYPCDLYLMDLDGLWSDTVIPNGIFDIDQNEHTNGTGDWTPEIWIARISPSSIGVAGFNYTTAYQNYFARNSNLRNGITYRPHKALLYIDDDWSSYQSEWLSNFTAYTGSDVDCYWNNPTTTATHYMTNISTGMYEFVHLLVHSWPTRHLFGPPYALGSEGTLTYKNIYGNSTLPLFYNLYACFSCNYTQANNTGTYYLFSDSTLTVIGSARDGGMDLYQPFYDSLDQGAVIGDAFVSWFHNPEIVKWNKELLYYGMTILGDPLLTIYMT